MVAASRADSAGLAGPAAAELVELSQAPPVSFEENNLPFGEGAR